LTVLEALRTRFKDNPKARYRQSPETQQQCDYIISFTDTLRKIEQKQKALLADRTRACFIGGAIGDALGAPVEFMTISEIRRRYGPCGITGYVEFDDGTGAVTDDTQMTLFTAEGLLRAVTRIKNKGICDPPTVVHRAYLRWLMTQGVRPQIRDDEFLSTGWLVHETALCQRRAPGNTCLSALRESRGLGEFAVNNSKGCGAVMRVAPVAFSPWEETWEIACHVSRLTHGHVCGYHAGGALAVLLKTLAAGSTLSESIDAMIAKVAAVENETCELLRPVYAVLDLARNSPATPETVDRIGGGWVAEETLAIALFCALKHQADFRAAVLLAANISGDSDSTAAVTGNIMGALLGMEGIPPEWRDGLRERDIVERVADDFCVGYEDSDAWRTKYPDC
jgi:ADP-ribosylglycohydrolase